MKKTLITSDEMTDDQNDRIQTLAKDAVRKALKVLKLTKPSAQQIIAQGDELQDAIIDKLRELGTLVKSCLKCISRGKKVVIGPTTGKEILATASDIFNHIDSCFESWGCNEAEEPTKPTPVEVHELIEDAKFDRIFGSLGQNLDRLCLTTSQIKSFVASHADRFLREDGWAYFLFLFKVKAKKEGEKDQFFVAYVYRRSDGHRRVDVGRFLSDCVWNAVYRRRVVVPQLTLES